MPLFVMTTGPADVLVQIPPHEYMWRDTFNAQLAPQLLPLKTIDTIIASPRAARSDLARGIVAAVRAVRGGLRDRFLGFDTSVIDVDQEFSAPQKAKRQLPPEALALLRAELRDPDDVNLFTVAESPHDLVRPFAELAESEREVQRHDTLLVCEPGESIELLGPFVVTRLDARSLRELAESAGDIWLAHTSRTVLAGDALVSISASRTPLPIFDAFGIGLSN